MAEGGKIVHKGSLCISKRQVVKIRKKRWFVLQPRLADNHDQDLSFSLRFYKDESCTSLDGEIPLSTVSSLTSCQKRTFQLTTRARKTYALKADNEREKIVWMAKIQEIMSKQSYYVQMTSCQQTCPLDRLLCVTQGDLVLMCPVTSLPTHSWNVVSLHSFGTSGPQLWLQKCKECNQETSEIVFLTIGSGACACEEIFEQVCAVACGNGAADKNVLSQSDTVTGHTKTFYLAAHQGHEQHSPSPTPQQGQVMLVNRALSPEALATNTSVSDDKWSAKSVSYDHPDSGFSTRSNSGVLNTSLPPLPHMSAVRQGSLPIPSHHRPTPRSRLQKGSLPLLDYPVSSASCGSLDAYKRTTEDRDDLLEPHYDNNDAEDVFVFVTHPTSQPPSRKLVSARSQSDALPQMMKNTRVLTTALTQPHLTIKPPATQLREQAPPSPPIPPRPAKTLVPSPIPKRKCASA